MNGKCKWISGSSKQGDRWERWDVPKPKPLIPVIIAKLREMGVAKDQWDEIIDFIKNDEHLKGIRPTYTRSIQGVVESMIKKPKLWGLESEIQVSRKKDKELTAYNKSLVNHAKEIVNEYLETGKDKLLDKLDKIIAPDYKMNQMGHYTGSYIVRELVVSSYKDIPDLELAINHVEIDAMIAEKDKVAVRTTIACTLGEQLTEDLTLEPGTHFPMTRVDILHIKGGMIVRGWGYYNMMDLIEQMGLEFRPS